MNENIEKTILLVEDDTILRRMFQLAMESAGFRVLEAGNGRMARDHLQKETPDLLITDLQMPEMDGLQLVQWVRRHVHGDLPILVLTSLANQATGKEALALGANRVAIKPIDLHTLLGEIHTLFTP